MGFGASLVEHPFDSSFRLVDGSKKLAGPEEV
jgi:hypothetical protein